MYDTQTNASSVWVTSRPLPQIVFSHPKATPHPLDASPAAYTLSVKKKTTGKNQYVSLISPNASRERFTAIPIFSRAIYRTLCRDLPKKNSDELCLQNRRFVVFYVEPITLRNAT